MYSYYTTITLGYVGVAAIFCFFLVGFVLNKFIIASTAAIVYLQQALEGDFRYSLVNIRHCAEQIALLRGATSERGRLDKSLNKVVQNQRRVIKRHWLLNSDPPSPSLLTVSVF